VLPSQFSDPAFQFTPLLRGNLRSPWTGDKWRNDWMDYDGAAWWLAERGDIGVRLGPSGLVVIDCDRVVGWLPAAGGREMRKGLTVDGEAALRAWLTRHKAELPPTFAERSPGRPDGSHEPGIHYWFRQNPDYPVHSTGDMSARNGRAGWEVKADYLVRFTSDSEVVCDAPVAGVPLALAKLIWPGDKSKRRGSAGGFRQSARNGEVNGLNDFYTKIKGMFIGYGLGSPEEADAAIDAFNQALNEPMARRRLEDTVLRDKGWLSPPGP
jgi:bifunctional DNA primase/polymerase-like protein